MNDRDELIDVSCAQTKEELIRALAKLRLQSDVQAARAGVSDKLVDSFSIEELASLPESTIVNITDAYFILKKQKVSDSEIFKRIEMQRSLLGDSIVLPGNLNAKKYIKYRLKMEHPQIESLEDMIVEMEIRYAVHWFSTRSTGVTDWKDADAFARQAITTIRGKYLATEERLEVGDATAQAQEEEPRSHVKGVLIGIIVLALMAGLAYWFILRG